MEEQKKYGIKITYSWGDEDDPDEYGIFGTPEEAYKKACELAGKEAYMQNTEMREGADCQVYFSGYRKEIELIYFSDAEVCKYKVVDLTPEETYRAFLKKDGQYVTAEFSNVQDAEEWERTEALIFNPDESFIMFKNEVLKYTIYKGGKAKTMSVGSIVSRKDEPLNFIVTRIRKLEEDVTVQFGSIIVDPKKYIGEASPEDIEVKWYNPSWTSEEENREEKN